MARTHPPKPIAEVSLFPEDEPGNGPPFLGTWSRVYIAVLAILAGLITVLAILTRVFAS